MTVCYEASPALVKMHFMKPGAEQEPEIVYGEEIMVSGRASLHHIGNCFLAVKIRILGQGKDDSRMARSGLAEMLAHNPQNIELVGIAHHIGREKDGRGQIFRERIAVMQGDGGKNELRGRRRFPVKNLFGFQLPRSQKTVIAAYGILKRPVTQILPESAQIMVKSRQQDRAPDIPWGTLAFDYIAGVIKHIQRMLNLETDGKIVPLILAKAGIGVSFKSGDMSVYIHAGDIAPNGSERQGRGGP